MTKKPPQKSAASAKAGAKRAPKHELAIALSVDAEQLLQELASEAGCSVDELAADLLLKQIAKRARQKDKVQTSQVAPLEAYLEMPPRQGGVAAALFEGEAEQTDHLSFKKISERQRKQSSKKLGTLFDDLPID